MSRNISLSAVDRNRTLTRLHVSPHACLLGLPLIQPTVDIASGRSQIRRFALNSSLPSGNGWSWEQGELLGWGLRNAVGIALSQDGNDLWEVENSSDNVNWRGLDVHQDNPG